MCGISGIVSRGRAPVDGEALLRMREAMRVRGPDGEGAWIRPGGGVGLAHTRLAVLDPSDRGAQPMRSADGVSCVVFNGEIYNHPELRQWCESRGTRYVSGSDTETLLHLYALEGPDFVKRLRGMFAFALWDERRSALLLARDAFGIKPLYYSLDAGELRFASQVKALVAGGVDGTVDPAGLASFLIWGYVTEPFTWHRRIKAVPAGSTILVDRSGRISLRRYHRPSDAVRRDRQCEPPARPLPEALLDSVEHHLLSDVPVGLFLSAGVDSGTLCALTQECADPATLQSVTVRFAEHADTSQDEGARAGAVAARYGCPHEVVTFGRADFEAERDRIVEAMDQPTVDGINTYFVSAAAARVGLKVALSGVGADEAFGGYGSFREVPGLARATRAVPRRLGRGLRKAIAPLSGRLPSPKYAGLLEYGGTVPGAYLLRRAVYMPWELGRIVDPDLAAAGLAELDLGRTLDEVVQGIDSPYEQVMALEQEVYLRNCLLRDTDWAGMAHSLEIRTPFVDRGVWDAVVSLNRARPAPLGKGDLFRTPRLPLPPEQQRRAKTGFNVPVMDWVAPAARARRGDGRRQWALALLGELA